MPDPKRGEVWWIDLGLAGKVRPALVLSVPPGLQDRSLATVVAHTTSLRGSQFEVAVRSRFLKPALWTAQKFNHSSQREIHPQNGRLASG